jgi:hypothetical protein
VDEERPRSDQVYLHNSLQPDRFGPALLTLTRSRSEPLSVRSETWVATIKCVRPLGAKRSTLVSTLPLAPLASALNICGPPRYSSAHGSIIHRPFAHRREGS